MLAHCRGEGRQAGFLREAVCARLRWTVGFDGQRVGEMPELWHMGGKVGMFSEELRARLAVE